MLLTASTLHAQELSPLRVGVRANVSSTDSTCTRRFLRPCRVTGAVLGVVTGVTPDTLTLQVSPGVTLAVPRNASQRIYVSRGKSRWRTAVRNAAGQALLAYIFTDLSDASQRSRVRVTAAFGVGGLAMGALFPAHYWQRVRQ